MISERVAHLISRPTGVFHHDNPPSSPPYEAFGDDPAIHELPYMRPMNEGVVYTLNTWINNTIDFVDSHKEHIVALGAGVIAGALIASEIKDALVSKPSLKAPLQS